MPWPPFLSPLLSLARLLARLALILIGVPLLLLAALLLAANTDPGQRLLVDQVDALSGGRVRLQGLEGHLPLAPRLGRLEISDDAGPWLTLDDAALDLNPWPLLRGRIQVTRLSAAAVHLERLPASDAEPEEDPAEGEGWYLPPLELGQLSIQRLTLGEVLPGAPPDRGPWPVWRPSLPGLTHPQRPNRRRSPRPASSAPGSNCAPPIGRTITSSRSLPTPGTTTWRCRFRRHRRA